jgi:hypothetical protein
MTRTTKDEAVMNSNYESDLITALSPSTSFNVFGGHLSLVYPRNPRSTFGCGDAALSRSRKPQRRLREIRRRHLFNQLDDSVLPFASDLLQIRIVLIEPHSRIRQQ